jgi:plasmid replication initiation protein
MQLRSVYSVRLFELLKQYQSIGERHFSIQEIRDFCGIEDKKYTNIQDIKRYVLDIAQKEINEKTDIFIDFEFIKTSRKFTGVDFTITTNRHYKTSGEEVLKKERINQLRSEFDTRKRCIEFIINIGFSNSTVEKMTQHLGDYDLENAVKSVQMQIEKGNVLNTKAMIRTAIKERWKPDIFLNKNN